MQKNDQEIRSLDPASQPGSFNQEKWLRWFDGEYFPRDDSAVEVLRRFSGKITRADIFQLAQMAKASNYDVPHIKQVWIAAYVWGGGVGATGYRARVNARLAVFDRRFNEALRTTLRHLGRNKIVDAYQSIDPIVGAGEGFFTKFLYFISTAGLCHPLPLIYDQQVRRALQALLGKRWAIPMGATMGDTQAEIYALYVSTMHNWADMIGCSPEQLELFLFEKRGKLSVGPHE